MAGWMKQPAKDGLLPTPYSIRKFTQTRTQRLDVTANIEPWSDLKIDLSLFQDRTVPITHSFSKVYLMKIRRHFRIKHLNPIDQGSYSISYLPIQTMFTKITKEGFSDTYKQFEANRSLSSHSDWAH
jgi:cell surface protein SprA